MTKEQVAYDAMVARLNTPEQKAKLKAVVEEIGGDGWSILEPSFFLDKGIDQELIGQLSVYHASDGSYKGSIHTATGTVPGLSGVYTLHFLRTLGTIFDVSSSKMGRGFQASELSTGLAKKLGGA